MIVVSLIDGRIPLAASRIETSVMRLYFGRVIVALVLLLETVGSAPAQDGAAATLAPTGELRVAIQVWNPVLTTRSLDGKFSGVSVDLADAFAAKLGVPVKFVTYENQVHYNRGAATNEWDIGLTARDLSQSGTVAFSNTVMEVDNGYVARAGLSLTSVSDVDRSGIKVAVTEGSPLAGYLSRMLTNARLVRLPVGSSFARDALSSGRADVYADSAAQASRIAMALSGAVLLLGKINTVQMVIAVPKKNAAALNAVNEFVTEAKKDGSIADAIKRANLRGVRPPR